MCIHFIKVFVAVNIQKYLHIYRCDKNFHCLSCIMSRIVVKTEIELYVINKVREKRTALNISQSELAMKLDLSVGFIGHIESPHFAAKYNLNHIMKLAKIFNCSPREFLPETVF